ncbi:MAG: hypothetical protein FWE03_07010 [Firmicutes bacterium]|nr:hypothetical protein [Bacillota bacterium]
MKLIKQNSNKDNKQEVDVQKIRHDICWYYVRYILQGFYHKPSLMQDEGFCIRLKELEKYICTKIPLSDKMEIVDCYVVAEVAEN